MFPRNFPRQVPKRLFSTNGNGFKITWVSVDWYRFRGGNLVLPFELQEVPTTASLRKEIAKEIALLEEIRVSPRRVRISHKSRILDLGKPTPVVPEDSPLQVTIEPTEEETAALKRGERFVDALWKSTPQVVTPDKAFLSEHQDPQIKVMKNIPHLLMESGQQEDIILRYDTEAFWDDVIGKCGSMAPFCVVGSPGIGKSMSVIVPMKKVLENGHPVTYVCRTESERGFYFQFLPQADGVPEVRVYPESAAVEYLPTMDNPDAFLFVDPGMTKTSCNWSLSILARLVISASPDERHWGAAEFLKRRKFEWSPHGGTFRYYRGYTLEELLVARPHIDDSVSASEVAKRFFEFGGSVRNVFGSDVSVLDASRKRQKDLEVLSREQAEGILYGRTVMNHMSPDAPSSTVLDLVPSADFQSYTSPAQSRVVEMELLARVDMQSYYNVISSAKDGPRPRETEKFLAGLLRRSEALQFRTRPCVGKRSSSYQTLVEEKLGGCTDYAYVEDIAAKIDELPDKTLVLPYRHNHPLFDMMYRDGNVYYGFNATTSSQNKPVNEGLIAKLAKNLKLELRHRQVRLYYATIADFTSFTTSPVNPEVPNPCVKLLHLDIGWGIVSTNR